MIDVSHVVQDARFAQSFSIQRQVGAFASEGAFSTTTTTLRRLGVVQPSSSHDIMQSLPEGERSGEFITVHTNEELRMGNGSTQESDVVLWRDSTYRVVSSKRWDQYGYWTVMARRFTSG